MKDKKEVKDKKQSKGKKQSPEKLYVNKDFKPKRPLSKFGKDLLAKLIGHKNVIPEVVNFSQAKGQFYGHYTLDFGFGVFPIPLNDFKRLFKSKAGNQ